MKDSQVQAQSATFYEKALRPTNSCCGAPNAFTQAAGYSAAELEALPADATGNSFGCGNPLAFAGVLPGQTVLDLGCGWGAVGVAAARSARDGRVVLTDVNRRAVRLARLNLERNRIDNAEVRVGPLYEPVADETFDVIATNPPFRAGRSAVLAILEGAAAHLVPDGRLVVVGKGTQGIRFYQEWLAAHWDGEVEVLGRGSGYRVLEARRRPVKRQP